MHKAQTERYNLTVKNALKSQLDAANRSHKLPMVILALRTLYRKEFDASAAVMLYGMNLRLLNQFYPTSTAWSDNPRAALPRHQQNVASYQYVPTRFPTNQKVHMNRRLLTCSHVMLLMNTNVTLSMHHGRVPGKFCVGVPKLTQSIGKGRLTP